jgi:hypothetical protein
MAVIRSREEICESERQCKEALCKETVYDPKSAKTRRTYSVVTLHENNETCCSINSITKTVPTPVDTFGPQKMKLPVL